MISMAAAKRGMCFLFHSWHLDQKARLMIYKYGQYIVHLPWTELYIMTVWSNLVYENRISIARVATGFFFVSNIENLIEHLLKRTIIIIIFTSELHKPEKPTEARFSSTCL